MRRYINDRQEEGVAHLVGNHAKAMAHAVRDKGKTTPVMDSNKWKERNKGNPLLSRNNEGLAKLSGNKVKACAMPEEMYLEWQKLSPEEQNEATKSFISYIPVLGSSIDACKAIKKRRYRKAAMNIGFGILEGVLILRRVIDKASPDCCKGRSQTSYKASREENNKRGYKKESREESCERRDKEDRKGSCKRVRKKGN